MTNAEKIAAIRRYMIENPREAGDGSVLDAAIFYLTTDEVEQAQYKIMLDSDKFWDKKKALRFLDTLGLLSEEYRTRLVRWGVL